MRGAALLLLLAFAAPGAALVVPPGADAFVVASARLRVSPAPDARGAGRLFAGTRVVVHTERENAVEVTPEGDVTPHGFLPRGSVAAFPAGAAGTREMAAAGRFLAQDASRLPLATALLARAAERLRCDGASDPELELLLGETSEALAVSGGNPPRGVVFRSRREGARSVATYDGEAFRRALETLQASADTSLRERAEAGLLRARFPATSDGFVALWSETAAWLDLAEKAELPEVISCASLRLERSALALGRLLLAAGRAEDLGTFARRVEAAATRTAALALESAPRLDGAARLLAAMRGNGGASFPQAAEWGAGPAPLTVRIDGELGALGFYAGSAPPLPLPVLPVPGSLRMAPDGRTAAWLEVSAPGAIVPMLVRLERTGPRGDATLLSGGRPTRDRTRKARVLSRLLGFSADGEKLLVSVAAWDGAPPARARLSLLSTRTGDLTWEAPGRAGRILEARQRLRVPGRRRR